MPLCSSPGPLAARAVIYTQTGVKPKWEDLPKTHGGDSESCDQRIRMHRKAVFFYSPSTHQWFPKVWDRMCHVAACKHYLFNQGLVQIAYVKCCCPNDFAFIVVFCNWIRMSLIEKQIESLDHFSLVKKLTNIWLLSALGIDAISLHSQGPTQQTMVFICSDGNMTSGSTSQFLLPVLFWHLEADIFVYDVL